MKVAIDLDGTLSKHPKELLALAECLIRGGASVFVLTAAAGELPKNLRPAEVKRRLDRLGIRLHAVCCETVEKPLICESMGVDVLIDDHPFKLRGTIQLMPA